MTKVASVTLGCKLNYAETSTYERSLRRDGWECVQWNRDDVDWYLVNTCSVTEHSDKKSRNIIRKLHRICPEARIVVTGCSASLRRNEIEKLDGVVKVFGASEKDLVAQYMISCRQNNDPASMIFPDIIDSGNCFFNAWSSGERTRSFLKIQDGCDFKCAYCTVPYARGESRSASIASILEDARRIAAEGIREIVLTGVNTGDFGRKNAESFLDLLKALQEVGGIERYRISSIEPNLLTEEIVQWIAGGTKFLPHFHIPLQCGCDAVLEKMGRRYRCKDFADKIKLIRSFMEKPGCQKVFFGIDVIAGFPGEGKAEFEESLGFLRDEIKPSFIHVFPYSRRPGTPAASMSGQVQESIKTERVAALEELSARLHADFLLSNKGLRSKVLYEEFSSEKNASLPCGQGTISGWSENYIKVCRKGTPEQINTIEEITL